MDIARLSVTRAQPTPPFQGCFQDPMRLLTPGCPSTQVRRGYLFSTCFPSRIEANVKVNDMSMAQLRGAFEKRKKKIAVAASDASDQGTTDKGSVNLTHLIPPFSSLSTFNLIVSIDFTTLWTTCHFWFLCVHIYPIHPSNAPTLAQDHRSPRHGHSTPLSSLSGLSFLNRSIAHHLFAGRLQHRSEASPTPTITVTLSQSWVASQEPPPAKKLKRWSRMAALLSSLTPGRMMTGSLQPTRLTPNPQRCSLNCRYR